MRPTLPAGRAGAAAVLLGLLLLTAARTAAQPAPPAPKKVLTHADYDAWRAATGVTLSRDGRYVAYSAGPTDGPGDGEIVVRHVPTGKDITVARGGRPPQETAADPTAPPDPARVALGGSPQFAPDSSKVVFPLAPTRAEVDKAKAAKARPDELPQPVLAIMDLPSGEIVKRIPNIKGYTVAGDGAGYLVYQVRPKAEPKADAPAGAKAEPAAPAGKGGGRAGFAKKGGGGGPPTGTPGAAPRAVRTYGTDLVVRHLASGREQTVPDVADYLLSKDGRTLVYTVAAKDDDRNGVYAFDPVTLSAAAPIKAGPGRYSRLVWDEKQTQLAFFHDTAGVNTDPKIAPMPRPKGVAFGADTREPALPPVYHLYVWDRAAKAAGPAVAGRGMAGWFASAAATTVAVPSATEVLGPDAAGVPKGRTVNGSTLSFSRDGTRLFVATVAVREPTPPPAPPPPGTPAADKVELDLWHWKDGYVQPMQKLRGDAERNRSDTAVVFLPSKEFRPLGEEALQVGPPAVGDWALGSTDKPYLHLTGYGPTLRDYALVNVKTGERKPVAAGAEGPVSASLDGKFLLRFDGKDWSSTAVPGGQTVNLTAKLPAKFFDEEDDHPMMPPSYGVAGWASDGSSVLVHDRYDVWKLAADGSSAVNLTKTGRPQGLRFRHVRIPADEDDDGRNGIDLSKPLLLTAENLKTRDTGFYRLEPGGSPRLLVMGARKYGIPVKAKSADVYLLTVQTFADFPDYFATGPDFHELKRVTDINPKAREYNWGRAEMVHYRSADGVPLSGILVKPEDFDPAKKYPLVVYLYERLSDTLYAHRVPNVTRGQVINPTFYASNGYLVLMPDIAYKVGAPGQSALKCVLPAVQAVVDQGCVDEAAIGINGQSWGGYQIAYMVTQTNRFKAASAGAAVSNMVSAYGGIRWGTGLPRQFQYERTQSRIGETLWKAPMRYIENSPVFMADRVETPLLMIHNDADDAVPWYQGIEYFLALRRLNKECYLLNYNGEPHNLAKKANARDFAVRMFQFFEHHLKGKPAPKWMTDGVPFADREKEKDAIKGLLPAEKK